MRAVPALVLSVCLAVPAAAGTLRVSDTDWPPFFLHDGSGPGLAHELIAGCLREVGEEPEFVTFDIEQTLRALGLGALDAHVMSYQPGRETVAWYGDEPLFEARYRPVVRAGEGRRIASLDGFDGLRLGHLDGIKYSPEFQRYVEKRRDAGTLEVATSNRQLVEWLLADRIDVFVNIETTARWVAKGLDASARIEVLPFDVKAGDYFLVLSRKSPRMKDPEALLEAFDGCLATWRRDGRYDAVVQRYTAAR